MRLYKESYLVNQFYVLHTRIIQNLCNWQITLRAKFFLKLNRDLASYKILHPLRNKEFYKRILSQMNSIHALRSYLLKIYENAMYLCLSSPCGLFPSGASTKFCTYFWVPPPSFYDTSDDFNSCSFHHPPVTSSFLGPNIQLSAPFSDIPNLYSSLNARTKTSYPRKQQIKIQF